MGSTFSVFSYTFFKIRCHVGKQTESVYGIFAVGIVARGIGSGKTRAVGDAPFVTGQSERARLELRVLANLLEIRDSPRQSSRRRLRQACNRRCSGARGPWSVSLRRRSIRHTPPCNSVSEDAAACSSRSRFRCPVLLRRMASKQKQNAIIDLFISVVLFLQS